MFLFEIIQHQSVIEYILFIFCNLTIYYHNDFLFFWYIYFVSHLTIICIYTHLTTLYSKNMNVNILNDSLYILLFGLFTNIFIQLSYNMLYLSHLKVETLLANTTFIIGIVNIIISIIANLNYIIINNILIKCK